MDERGVGGDGTMIEPAGPRRGTWLKRSLMSRPTGTPSTRSSSRSPKFDSTSAPTRASTPPTGTDRLEVPIPPAKWNGLHARAGADAPPRPRGHPRALSIASSTSACAMAPHGVVEEAVVALGDDRDHDVVVLADLGVLAREPRDGRVEDAADAERAAEQDRRLAEAPLVDLREARHLARAVEHVARGEHPIEEDVAVGRDDRGHARAHRTEAEDGARSPSILVTWWTRTPGTSVIAFSDRSESGRSRRRDRAAEGA